MRVGIRFKLVALLTAVALVPLTAALIIILVGGRRLQTQSIGQDVMSLAFSGALGLEVSLGKEIDMLFVALQQESSVVPYLAGLDAEMSADERQALDAAWPGLSESSEPLRSILRNPVVSQLQRFRSYDSRMAEIIVTDRFGQLVAATAKTTDFYQADEDWWQGAYGGGRGCIFLPEINYDRSAGVWSIDICLPLLAEGQVVGVAKAVLDVSRWVRSVRRTVGKPKASVMLVTDKGNIIYQDTDQGGSEAFVPMQRQVPHWREVMNDPSGPGWDITPDGVIRGYAAIHLPETAGGLDVRAPQWVLVLARPTSEALAHVYHLGWILLAIGVAIVGGIFLLGVLLADRSLIQRVHRLELATRRVADGDLSGGTRRRQRQRTLLGPDEIDELAEGFDRMVGRIRASQELLETANRLKSNFISIAGHELRSPVSYILAMTRLLKECDDPQRLLQGVQSMAAKAHRLDGIIRSMFKLMLEGQLDRELRYGPVDVGELLHEVYVYALPFAQQRRQRLEIDLPESLPPIQGDASKLSDVVENLVMNAIKFTPDGGRVAVRAAAAPNGCVRIRVEDTGEGIPPEDLPHIFEPFYGTAEVMQHSSGMVGYRKRGMGLGLAIVKRFTELHGGRVRVDSSSSGTVFTVEIPTSPPPQGRQAGQDGS